MKPHKVTMELVRETKGALRYEGAPGTTEDPTGYTRLIGVLYLRKDAVTMKLLEEGNKTWPQVINVEIVPLS